MGRITRYPFELRKQVSDVEQEHGHGQVDAHLVKDVEQFFVTLVGGTIGCGNDDVAHNGKQRGRSSDGIVNVRAFISEIQRRQGRRSQHGDKQEEFRPQGPNDSAEVFDFEVLEQGWCDDAGLEQDDAHNHAWKIEVHGLPNPRTTKN